MFDPSYTRFAVENARRLTDTDKREEKLMGLMAAAMVELRRERSGGVTRRDLAHCGFTDYELNHLGERATSIASRSWHRGNMLEEAA